MTRIDVRQMRATYLGPRGYLRDYTVRGYQAERFEQLLNLARARGIRVVVINMPVTTEHEAFLSPPGLSPATAPTCKRRVRRMARGSWTTTTTACGKSRRTSPTRTT